MATTTQTKNWVQGKTPSTLKSIHRDEINIAIYSRGIDAFKKELHSLLKKDFTVQLSGDLAMVSKAILSAKALTGCDRVRKDLDNVLHLFSKITEATSVRLLFATVADNMCRKFHTDINDLRLLCTYEGPGTLWLTDDNVDWKALEAGQDDESFIINQNDIRQADPGDIVILKGAIYPKESTKAVLHRSPEIVGSKKKRLLLRIDTNTRIDFNI